MPHYVPMQLQTLQPPSRRIVAVLANKGIALLHIMWRQDQLLPEVPEIVATSMQSSDTVRVDALHLERFISIDIVTSCWASALSTMLFKMRSKRSTCCTDNAVGRPTGAGSRRRARRRHTEETWRPVADARVAAVMPLSKCIERTSRFSSVDIRARIRGIAERDAARKGS